MNKIREIGWDTVRGEDKSERLIISLCQCLKSLGVSVFATCTHVDEYCKEHESDEGGFDGLSRIRGV